MQEVKKNQTTEYSHHRLEEENLIVNSNFPLKAKSFDCRRDAVYCFPLPLSPHVYPLSLPKV